MTGIGGRLRAFVTAALAVAAASLALTAQVELPLNVILERATAYVAAYVKALSSTVSEERYEQTVRRVVERGAAPPERQMVHRVLVSDYLLVQMPGSTEWTPFRDVYSVDGAPIRDRSDRLLKLFLEPTATSRVRARQIRDESSRYNIGSATRDINVPTFALQILSRELRGDFEFKQRGRQRVDDLDTIVVEYVETARPTMIRGRNDENVPATGRFWIVPDSGCVLRWVLETRPTGMQTKIDVTFRYDSSLGIHVPAEMNERHDVDGGEVVEGRSTYAKVRRFRVDTTFEIK